jgi:hypothetical protein
MRFAGTQLSNFLGDTMDYSAISSAAMEGRSLERKAVMGAEANVANAGVQSMGKVASAGFQADAIKAAGAAQGQASMASGIGSMASGIAGGIGSMPTGGSSDFSGAPMKATNAVPSSAYSTYSFSPFG